MIKHDTRYERRETRYEKRLKNSTKHGKMRIFDRENETCLKDRADNFRMARLSQLGSHTRHTSGDPVDLVTNGLFSHT